MTVKKLEIVQLKNKNLVKSLGWLLDQAIAGHITGACIVVQHNRFKHAFGIMGEYSRDPYCANRAVKKLKKVIKKEAKKLEDFAQQDIQ